MPAPPPVLMVDPALLRWARETAGLSVEDGAKRAGTTEEKLSSWEKAEARLTARQLERLADLYKRPVATFFMPEPPIEPPLPVDFRLLTSEKPRALSRDTLLAVRRARRVQRIYSELAPALAAQVSVDLQTIGIGQDPEICAQQVKEQLGVSIEVQASWRSPYKALRTWRDATERRGILVFQFSMPLEEVRGFSLSSVPVIVLNTRDSHAARIFTLFHEWAHLLLRKPGICIPEEATRPTQRDDIEVFCNAFAGAFLVPRAALLQHPSILAYQGEELALEEAVTAAEEAFSVSKYVILRRLLTTKVILAEDYRRVVDQWETVQRTEQTKAKGEGGPSPAAKAVNELGRAFVSSVLRAHERGLINDVDLTDFLSIRLKHLARLHALVPVA